ncbi:4-hydroxy-tetrahydrodipicolinate synthase [Thermomonas haemolytica]|uniref:4-hydroxy-tetrahydrodipicolinate synthase n=1 Tax=Thermomonas haemolytica TaxID=141949 RepID=A0A4R3N8A3_9GAMM|nr:4-hydroxy-tetrahydrodipicolinate synthase [Thermomonas haemolytica]TCT24426.1 dihydrodipicolinate synthase [Thermomonas haemolytica]TNY29364.1 4-hydroxy-tetrahydrodipicolinate synthase [Thermomonas haemolytica]
MRLSGSITALATPFTAAGDIDFPAWERLLQAQLAAGTQAVVVAGSTGEAAALSDEEYERLLRHALETCAGRIPVLAGTGQSNTAKTVQATRRAARLGADAALVVTPPYVRPTQAGLLAHFRAVADDGGLPVVLYNVPGRTGCDMLAETTGELSLHANIIGIKEARAEEERMQALLPLRREDFVVLSGDDPTALRAMLAGADGVISVASNVVPRSFRRLCDAALAGDAATAATLNEALVELYHFLGIEPNPIPVKALLALDGIGHGLRLPLQPLSSAHAAQAERLQAAIRQLEQANGRGDAA